MGRMARTFMSVGGYGWCYWNGGLQVCRHHRFWPNEDVQQTWPGGDWYINFRTFIVCDVINIDYFMVSGYDFLFTLIGKNENSFYVYFAFSIAGRPTIVENESNYWDNPCYYWTNSWPKWGAFPEHYQPGAGCIRKPNSAIHWMAIFSRFAKLAVDRYYLK